MYGNEREQDRRRGARTPEGIEIEKELLRRRRNWRLLLALELVVLTGVIALAIQTAGCGNSGSGTSSSGDAVTSASSGATAAPAVAQAQDAPAHVASAGPSAGPVVVPTATDTLPPEVEVLAAETVTPGEVVEVTAETSPDVVSVTLADGRGRPQPMRFDRETGQWTAPYRVPIRIRGERLALSVTARNGAERWRRVWVFMTLAEQIHSDEPDSLTGK